jgi:23S rRNA (uracil1939-C5)-methyltransferase
MPEELLVSIEKLIYGGEGLAHTDGNTIFVPYVLPGEQVRAAAKSKKKRVIWAQLLEVTSPAQQRATARCRHFQTCGGCHYQHIPAAEQLRLKKEILCETLARLGGVKWEGPIQEHASPAYEYRNRAQWAFRDAKPRALGYFLPESSTIVPIDECSVLSPLLAKTFGQLQEMTRAGRLPEQIQEIEAFADSADARVALNVAFERFPKPAPELAATLHEALPQLESLLLLDQGKDRFELTGPGYLIHEAGGFRYRVSHLSFFQVNRFLTEELLRTVVAGKTGDLALDLYAGVGFFTLPLAKTFQRVISVDANLAATRDLRVNAESAGVAVTSHNQHAEEFLAKAKERPDLIVLDPPRSGLGAEAAGKLAALGAAEITCLSCDPSTLARDLAQLLGTGKSATALAPGAARYEISEMHLFDLFPQTYHIETLVRLRRAL